MPCLARFRWILPLVYLGGSVGKKSISVPACLTMSAEATLLAGLVTFSPVELLTVNPFHLKKGSMLPASNDNFIELAAGKGAILSRTRK
jgi:hypothetical protein